MGFLRKTTFVLTGGTSGLVFKANSKKERTARAAEEQTKILSRLVAQSDDTMVIEEVDEEEGVFHLTLSDELRNLGELHAEGILSDDEFADAKRQLLG